MKSGSVKIVSMLFIAGMFLAFYFREPAQPLGPGTAHSSSTGVAGLLGIAVAMVVIRFAIGNGRDN